MNLKFRRKDTPPEFPDVVTWAAWLYYIDQMTQIDVAKAIGVSRASVVNYLQEARERGLVSIHFDQKSISETVISKSLQEKYGLTGCLVIPKTVESLNLSERLGVAAARILFSMLKSNDVISVAWGKTVLAAAQAIPHSQLDNLTVVQVVGSFHSTVEFSPEFCTSVLANRLNARCMNFLAPAILSSKGLKEELLKEEVLVNQFKTIKSSRIIVFGIGAIAGPIVCSALMNLLGPNGLFVHFLIFFILIIVFGLYRLNQRKYEDNPESTFTPLPTNITPLGIELDPETGVDLSNTENKKS